MSISFEENESNKIKDNKNSSWWYISDNFMQRINKITYNKFILFTIVLGVIFSATLISTGKSSTKIIAMATTRTFSDTISSNILSAEYTVELDRFGISKESTSPIETSKGINSALQYAKEHGYTKVIMPLGEYIISEDLPISMVDNMILDLNKSTFKINTHGKLSSTVINFVGVKNAKLVNGTILGDRYTHDYNTIKGSHEWNYGVSFNESENCELNNVTVKSFPGYGIFSSLGKNISNLVIGVTKNNLTIGSVSEQGVLNNNSGTIRTASPMDINRVGGEFELGYNQGYMGYPYINSKTYDVYFYNTDMKFISTVKMAKQYKKVSIPQEAVYAHFVFHQSNVPAGGNSDFNGTTIFLTNYKSPYKISITNCFIEDNRSLGMGICGGREWTIENNTFSKNGGSAPGYAIDMEDGWEYMDKFLFKGNKFTGNNGDIVIPAGDNIIFENNHFTSTVYMYPRATNYKFINNKFENINYPINYQYSTDTIITGNTYINSKLGITSTEADAKILISNENLINTSVNSISDGAEMINSTITTDGTISIRLAGAYRNSRISVLGGEYISAKLYECSVVNSKLNAQGDTLFQNSTLINSTTNTTTNTRTIKVINSKFTNSNFIINTWGSASEVVIQNSEINMTSGNNPFINISAGKTKNLVFKNNRVVSFISKPIFNMFDTTYSLPKGSAVIEDNLFAMNKYACLYDGVNISSGIFTFTSKNNSMKDVALLNPRYINNKYFVIQ